MVTLRGQVAVEQFTHQAVLMHEVDDALALRADSIVVDGTFGRGGHASLIMQALGPQGSLLAIDKDPEAIKVANQQWGKDQRFQIEQGSFAMLKTFCEKYDMLGRVDALLLDLGVSSPQLDDARRGFSFSHSGPLDMRMDPHAGISAAEWLAQVEVDDLVQVLRDYGEERYAKRIAAAIVNARAVEPITRTDRLAEVIAAAHPKWEKHKHPATRCFQAIRIFINNELDDLKSVLQQALECLAIGGRLVIISFHSLEDRLVKRFIHQHSKADTNLPPDLPIRASELPTPRLKRVGKAHRASSQELGHNRRARSAILRVAERLS